MGDPAALALSDGINDVNKGIASADTLFLQLMK
jgi:hypothetical protein